MPVTEGDGVPTPATQGPTGGAYGVRPDGEPSRDYTTPTSTTTSSGSSGGGTTSNSSSSSSSTPYDGPGKDYNDEDPSARFLGIGGHPEVWKIGDKIYLVYFAEGTEPPVPLLFEVDDEDTLQAFFGEGEEIVYDRTMTAQEANSTGAVKFGTSDNLAATEGDPWVGFLDRIERLEEVSPWIGDDEILALVAGAYLEGREVFEWELKTTDWWRTHNEQEREWLQLQMGDPMTAQRRVNDNKLYIQTLFEKIGADGNDQALIDWIAMKYTTGAWSEQYTMSQIEAVTSGWSTVDEELDTFMSESGMTAASSNENYEKVRALWNEWLGPAYQPSDDELKKWATKIRNTADGEDELITMLRAQRLALFPEYTDPNRTWQDISRPWKNMAYQIWGVEADELDPRFQEIVRMNDANEAQKKMRAIGVDEGYQKVIDSMVQGIDMGMARSVRGVV